MLIPCPVDWILTLIKQTEWWDVRLELMSILTNRLLCSVKSRWSHPWVPRRIISWFLSAKAFSFWVAFTCSSLWVVKLVWIQNVFDSKWCDCVSWFLQQLILCSWKFLCLTAINAGYTSSTPVVNKRVDRKAIIALHGAIYFLSLLTMHGESVLRPVASSAHSRSYETFCLILLGVD